MSMKKFKQFNNEGNRIEVFKEFINYMIGDETVFPSDVDNFEKFGEQSLNGNI